MTTFTEKVEEIFIEFLSHLPYSEDSSIEAEAESTAQKAIILAHQAEISRVLERVEALKKERPVSGPNRNGTSECKRKAYNSAISDALEAINKIKGEYSE